MIHRRGLAVVAVLSVFGLAACSTGDNNNNPGSTPSTDDVEDRPYAGTTVRFLRHAGYDADLMQAEFAQFTEETGIEVQMDTVPYSDLHSKEVVELSSGSGTYDLIAIPDFWVAEYGAAGWLQPLNAYLEGPDLLSDDFDLDDIPQPLQESNAVEGDQLALPWKFNTLTLFYRSDLVAEAPSDWSGWLATAEENTGDGSFGVGLSLAPADFSELFLDLVKLNGGEFLNEDNTEALFNSREGLKALEFLQQMLQYAPEGAVNRVWDDNAALMAQGVTATDLLIPYQASVVDAEDSLVQGKVAYATLPPAEAGGTSTSKLNTWGLAISANAQNPEAAYLLLQHLLSPGVMGRITEDGGGSIVPARSSILSDPALQEQFHSFAAAQKAAETAWSYPKIPNIAAIENILATTLQAVLVSSGDLQEALDTAAQQVNQELAS